MTEQFRRAPPFLMGAGWIGVFGSVLLAARTDDGEFGSGLVFNTVLGFGMLAGGFLPLGGAVAAEHVVYKGAAMRSRRKTIFFRITGVIGLLAFLYGAALLGGGGL
jgi:hypothetical protein